MSYYQGDYYMGDYYRGDPFLGLGKIWGGIKKVGKWALGIGGGGGISKEDLQEALSQRAPAPVMAGIPSPGIAGGMALGAGGMAGLTRMAGWGTTAARLAGGQEGWDIPGPLGTVRPRRILPGGVPFYSPEQCPTGYHMDKTTGTRCVRNRRMNVANPRALRRGLRRVAGFGKLAQRARRDIGRAATAVGAGGRRRGPVARHHARIRAKG